MNNFNLVIVRRTSREIRFLLGLDDVRNYEEENKPKNVFNTEEILTWLARLSNVIAYSQENPTSELFNPDSDMADRLIDLRKDLERRRAFLLQEQERERIRLSQRTKDQCIIEWVRKCVDKLFSLKMEKSKLLGEIKKEMRNLQKEGINDLIGLYGASHDDIGNFFILKSLTLGNGKSPD